MDDNGINSPLSTIHSLCQKLLKNHKCLNFFMFLQGVIRILHSLIIIFENICSCLPYFINNEKYTQNMENVSINVIFAIQYISHYILGDLNLSLNVLEIIPWNNLFGKCK